jgi:hypothetical protein
MTQVFVTKYALTTGIASLDVELKENDMCIHQGDFPTYYHKGEWFTDFKLAVENAETRRKNKIASLERSIAKLRALNLNKGYNQ